MFRCTKFEITQEELDKIREWDKTHECIYKPQYGTDKYCGAIGGNLSITFTPTSVGEIVEVKCGCGKKLVVRELFCL